MSESQINSKDTPSIEEIKLNFETKKFENVLNLTKIIYNNNNCNEYALKARYSCFIEKGGFSKIIQEVIHCLIKDDTFKEGEKKKKSFKDIFQENYRQIKDKNVLFEFFYSMYKLKKYKKLNGCLKYFKEHENKYEDFIDVLLAEVNFKLHNFDVCINSYEFLLRNNKAKQVIAATVNLNSSYFSLYIKLLYEYNFLRKKKNTKRSQRKEKYKNNKDVKNEKHKKSISNRDGNDNDNDNYSYNYNSNDKINSNCNDDSNGNGNTGGTTVKAHGAIEFKDIQNLKDQIAASTNDFNYDKNDSFEQLFNYATFFAIEKNFSEALKFLDILDDVCNNTLIAGEIGSDNADISVEVEEEGVNGYTEVTREKMKGANMSMNHVDELSIKRVLIQMERAYVYSKTNKVNEAISLYENILKNYDNNINEDIVLLAYNNYIALMHNDSQKVFEKKNSKKTTPLLFTINTDKLNQIKIFLIMNKRVHNELSEYITSTINFNECILSLSNNNKEEFKSKLAKFSLKFSNSVLLDRLYILLYKDINYLKCKHYIHNNIDLMNSVENKIKFINAYIYLCYEKKNYKDIVNILLKYQHIFQSSPSHYGIFFSNLFHIYICVNYKENCKKTSGSESATDNALLPHKNLEAVISLFEKYKNSVKTNIQIVNYETLLLVSKYLICHDKSNILIDIFDHLSKEVKNNFNFFTCFTYIYTYMNINNAYKYEDKLKKIVLPETYLIDVEELENKSIPFDSIVNNNLSSLSVDKSKRKRKRLRKKNKKSIETLNNQSSYDPDKWLPKHEKSGFKKSKKKKQKMEADKTKDVVYVEENKTQINQAKLQNLKKRRKK
ncbi:signal recognition particle subunit SRP72, putative [Plasmodium malariae]|uniref:Signal recognition particle subunit SRP72, putative n=1 Tax=Plasmodium malariae TaxID=5858 RepID=A0A1D3PC78_PLAMA|nr:signal recognition particle subunit SRP72, putative [Plasmodium malariae]SCN12882.1 signal recognition particle subunit SRP72, putative [Plasmodium malariae]